MMRLRDHHAKRALELQADMNRAVADFEEGTANSKRLDPAAIAKLGRATTGHLLPDLGKDLLSQQTRVPSFLRPAAIAAAEAE